LLTGRKQQAMLTVIEVMTTDFMQKQGCSLS
jgi:hypothetical protein